jgi:hypothetical protein
MNQTPILTADSKGLPLKILYAGEREVTRPNLVVVRFGNRGKVEIRSEDYARPVKVSFAKSKLIGSVLVDELGLDPETETELLQDGNSLTFTPPLLNKGEWIDLQFVTDGPIEVPTVTTRVAGQSGEITERALARKRLIKRVFIISNVVIGAIVAMYVVLGLTQARVHASILVSMLVLVTLSTITMLLSATYKDNVPTWPGKPKAAVRAKS